MTILTGIKLSVFVGNLLWIAFEYSHFHYSNMEVYGTLKTGKTSIALDNIQALLGKMDTYHKCINANKTNANSYTKEFVYLYGGLSNDAIEQLGRMDDISTCLQNPYIVLDAVEKSAWAGIGIDYTDVTANATTTDATELIIPGYVQSDQIAIIPRFQDLAVVVSPTFDIATYNRGVQQIQYEFAQSYSFTEGITYLEELTDPRNDNLAKKLLNDADFAIYKQEMDSYIVSNRNNTVINVRVAPTLYQRTTIILGTVYELFVSKPSHTHLFDIINKVRDTINEYSRNMRDQYNFYNDLFYDTRMELERITTKSTVAWKRASWLIVNTGILAVQLSELAINHIIQGRMRLSVASTLNRLRRF